MLLYHDYILSKYLNLFSIGSKTNTQNFDTKLLKTKEQSSW